MTESVRVFPVSEGAATSHGARRRSPDGTSCGYQSRGLLSWTLADGTHLPPELELMDLRLEDTGLL